MAESKTLKGNIDGWVIAAEIRVERQTHKGSFLILEGDTDEKALSRFIDEASCHPIIAFGKKNALDALNLLEEDGFPGIVALVDADFDNLNGSSFASENVVVTEFHDLDVVLFNSRAFDLFVHEHATSAKLEKYQDSRAIRSIILNAALPLGYARWIQNLRGLKINFGSIRFDFINHGDCTCDESNMLVAIENASKDVTKEKMKAWIEDVRSGSHDPRQVCNGHDVMEILGTALKGLLANLHDARTYGSVVAKGLRLAFDAVAFRETEVFSKLKTWEADNSPYILFQNI